MNGLNLTGVRFPLGSVEPFVPLQVRSTGYAGGEGIIRASGLSQSFSIFRSACGSSVTE